MITLAGRDARQSVVSVGHFVGLRLDRLPTIHGDRPRRAPAAAHPGAHPGALQGHVLRVNVNAG